MSSREGDRGAREGARLEGALELWRTGEGSSSSGSTRAAGNAGRLSGAGQEWSDQGGDGAAGAPRRARLRRDFEGFLGVPFTTGNRIERFVNGVEHFPAMLEAIAAARRSIEFLTYVYWTGSISERFAAALAERAAAGVRVRVLLDGQGARPMRKDLIEEMRASGAEVDFFRPLSWRLWRNIRRTHRKVLICDGTLGFTGGVGIAEEWEGDARDPTEWRDTHFRIEGPAVDGLRAAFIANWLEDGREWAVDREHLPEPVHPGDSEIQVIRASSSYGWNDVATLLRAAVSRAERSLLVQQAYFVPDRAMNALLCETVGRGVDVTIMTPGEHVDARVTREAGDDGVRVLLEAGARVFRYEPTMLHTKVLLVDDELAVIGSANFNHRSMLWDEEICLAVLDEELVRTLRDDARKDLERSREVTLETWRRRPWWKRVREDLSWLVHRHI